MPDSQYVRVAGATRGYRAHPAVGLAMDPIEGEARQFALRIATADPLSRVDDQDVFSFVLGVDELAHLIAIVFLAVESEGLSHNLDDHLEQAMKSLMDGSGFRQREANHVQDEA